MKICVYAIAKNEEQFVPKWVDSMQEADGIYVLDTGSTDHTAELLRENAAPSSYPKRWYPGALIRPATAL